MIFNEKPATRTPKSQGQGSLSIGTNQPDWPRPHWSHLAECTPGHRPLRTTLHSSQDTELAAVCSSEWRLHQKEGAAWPLLHATHQSPLPLPPFLEGSEEVPPKSAHALAGWLSELKHYPYTIKAVGSDPTRSTYRRQPQCFSHLFQKKKKINNYVLG